jgi:hypothetical protein
MSKKKTIDLLIDRISELAQEDLSYEEKEDKAREIVEIFYPGADYVFKCEAARLAYSMSETNYNLNDVIKSARKHNRSLPKV